MTTTDTDTTAERISRIYRTNLSTGRARLGELVGGQVEVESSGAWIRTMDGRRYLNAGGYGVFLMGARHPTVLTAIDRQLRTHPVGSRMFLEPMAAWAAEALIRVAPAGLTRVHFTGSGTEATETALKLARLNGRRQVISMRGGYHGKTLGALSVTGKALFQDPFRPLLPGITHVPFGSAEALAAALAQHAGEACVILEPIQGEAGVVIPPAGYLATVAALCAEYDALLIIDEIQTGLGRTGSWWAIEQEQVRPDILLSGKALGGGVLPVSAAIASEAVYTVLDRDPFLHTSTFAGAPIAMAAVCGALEAITDDRLVERAATLGTLLFTQLEAVVAQYFSPRACRLRGRGLLLGLEFADPAMATDLLVELVAEHVIANHSLNAERVVRLTPPAILDDNEVDFLLDRFENAVRTTASRYPES
ncbi:aspartate aminotransferase family protein [Nocardia goodfellowii]